MTDYFEERGLQLAVAGETPSYIEIARFLLDVTGDPELYIDGLRGKLGPPASKTVVENLPEVTVESSGGQCPVCLKEQVLQEKVKELPCKHKFHQGCIIPWLERTNSCPLCRFELPTDDKAYEEYRQRKLRQQQREEDTKVLHNSMYS